MISVLMDGEKKEIQKDVTLLELAKKRKNQKYEVVVAEVDNELQDLNYKIDKECQIKFLDMSTEMGIKIYVKSLSFVFIRAAREIIPNCKVTIEHSLAKGLYCEIKGINLNKDLVHKIEKRMREIVEKNEPIEKIKISKEEAIKIFEEDKQEDKVKIIKYIADAETEINKCGKFYDYFYGPLLPSTGYLKLFELKFYLPGVIIRHPLHYNPLKLPEYIPQSKLGNIFYEAERWGEIMEVGTVAGLNECILKNKFSLLMKVSEALHEKKIANIADQIYKNKDRGNVILIAGPSSSGKTTFANRLMIQLMVNGLKPISLSVDDYFVNREDTPIDDNGQYDFEALEAIDLELFNDNLSKLILGQEVELPEFNFVAGRREYHGKKIKINPDQPIIIEGIHGLNEKLTYSIPKDHKYKIYISALTQLNIDNHNRIHTTDTRKIRRIVRDNQFRGTNALETIKRWPSVRRGEEKNIFPFQEEADIMFNSALVYELAVLKNFVEPLLKAITPDNEEYIEARRLLKFLKCFVPAEYKYIPYNSILKEFIG